MTFFGLLHLRPSTQHVNVPRGVDPVSTYVACASTCARSAAAQGVDFALITNDVAQVERRLRRLPAASVEVVEQEFTLNVPDDVPFYSAHYKLEVLAIFGEGACGTHPGLIDIDGVIQRPLRPPPSGLDVYDITAQVVPAYGHARIALDLNAVTGTRVADVRWFGGEYISGSVDAFRHLSDCIRRCWPRYLEHLPQLHHAGDEMVLSAALALASAEGLRLSDAGTVSTATRWWSARTLHRQPSFRQVSGAAYLHLPSDKIFLARQAELRDVDFDSAYRRYFRSTAPHRRASVHDWVTGKAGGFKPRLGRRRLA